MRDLNFMRYIGMRLALVVVGVGLLLSAMVPSIIAAPADDDAAIKDTTLAPNEKQEPPAAAGTTGAGAKPVTAGGVAWLVSSVDLQPGRAVFVTEGKVARYRHFTLEAPSRLVVDLYGVRPSFSERTFAAQGGFSQMRVGTYQDRTRFVFDPASVALPDYRLVEQPGSMVLIWGPEAEVAAPKPMQATTAVPEKKPAPRVKGAAGRISVEAINFEKDNGKSQLVIELSGPAQLVAPTQKDNIVRFGIKNAAISKALRRTFDSSSFPSAVLRATPYTVLVGKRQDVRFAVELKGQVPYQLIERGNRVVFLVEDGAFVEPLPAVSEPLPVPVPGSLAATPVVADQGASEPGADHLALVPPEAGKTIGPAEPERVYTGEKIQLVFDDADVRDVFQLIAEVSNLNLIVSDDVKGSITLRLVNVPWDQALDLILEIKDLGMLKQGNVVRILPKEQIRAMEEARFTAARSKEKLEDLTTEVISVSYTALENVEKPCKELMTERGKITSDNRNKQVIVTDIPSVIDAVKKLIAILDTPERQVMIEARIVEASATFGRKLGVNWGVTQTDENSTNGWSTNLANLGIGGTFLITPADVIAGDAAGAGGNIQFGKLGSDSITLDLQLSALESSGSGKIISRPRISTLNGEKAKITQGTMIPYVTTTDDEIKTEFVEASLSLEVTPVINPDNSVMLEIKATNSAPGANVQVSTGGEAPEIDTKEAETKVLVHDGETTVIGGTFVENEDFAESGVPLLRSVPFLGNLFKSTEKNNTRTELLIFITPRILN